MLATGRVLLPHARTSVAASLLVLTPGPCAAAACAQLTPPSPRMSNGVHHQNGAAGAAAADDGAGSMDDGAGGASSAEYLGARQLINRGEYIRLLEQALHRLGFSEAARSLERDSARSLLCPALPAPGDSHAC
jgi:hypothetical protein